MLRWPQIIRLPDGSLGEARFLIVMETNGVDPTQRRPYLSAEYYLGKEWGPGRIFRVDLSIPAGRRNDPEYIAQQFTRAWAHIWRDTVDGKFADEGAAYSEEKYGLDAVDMEITPHWGISSKAANIDVANLYRRPGRVIKVNGPWPGRRSWFSRIWRRLWNA